MTFNCCRPTVQYVHGCKKNCRSRRNQHVCCVPFIIILLPRCMKCRRGIAMRILSVCLSVRLSVRHTRDPWQNGRKIGPDFYTIRKNIYPSFLRRRMVGGARPLLREILGQPTPVGAKSPIFNQYPLVAPQP